VEEPIHETRQAGGRRSQFVVNDELEAEVGFVSSDMTNQIARGRRANSAWGRYWFGAAPVMWRPIAIPIM
jgi:hypothetical protein